MFSTTSSQFCCFHPYGPDPEMCMTCSVNSAADAKDANMEGAKDFASPVYPEIDTDSLAGPGSPYRMASTMSFRAPVAKMFSPSIPPMLKINTDIKYISRCWYPPFETSVAVHDHYIERLALSPIDRPEMYAGYHYSDKGALSPIQNTRQIDELPLSLIRDTGYSYSEVFALSPVSEKPPGARRGRKPKSGVQASKKSEPVALLEDKEQTDPQRSRTKRQIKDQDFEESPIEEALEKVTRAQKHKHLVEEEEQPVRRSKRSHKAISYAEYRDGE